MRGIEAQFLALQKGFNELIPQHLLKPFDQKELEVGRAGLGCEGLLCAGWSASWAGCRSKDRVGGTGASGSPEQGRRGPVSLWWPGVQLIHQVPPDLETSSVELPQCLLPRGHLTPRM